jgi:AcrR family transcriptional regulator
MDATLVDRFVEATVALLAEDGLDGVTADKIAERSHTGKASLYRRWEGLDDLYADLIRRALITPVHYRGEGDQHTALVDLLAHHVNGPVGVVTGALLARVPHHEGIRGAWMSQSGPKAVLTIQFTELVTAYPVLERIEKALRDEFARLVAQLRTRRVLGGYVDLSWALLSDEVTRAVRIAEALS